MPSIEAALHPSQIAHEPAPQLLTEIRVTAQSMALLNLTLRISM